VVSNKLICHLLTPDKEVQIMFTLTVKLLLYVLPAYVINTTNTKIIKLHKCVTGSHDEVDVHILRM
jgi:hypothetical protein